MPERIALFARRPEPKVRTTILRTFGFPGDSSTFTTTIDALAVPELRADAMQSLDFFGDPRAIPPLEACVDDEADAWPKDGYGPMLGVCDVAANAIANRRRPSRG